MINFTDAELRHCCHNRLEAIKGRRQSMKEEVHWASPSGWTGRFRSSGRDVEELEPPVQLIHRTSGIADGRPMAFEEPWHAERRR